MLIGLDDAGYGVVVVWVYDIIKCAKILYNLGQFEYECDNDNIKSFCILCCSTV